MQEFLRLTAWGCFYVGYVGVRVTPVLGAVWLSKFALHNPSLDEFYDVVGVGTGVGALVTVIALLGGLTIKSLAGPKTSA